MKIKKNKNMSLKKKIVSSTKPNTNDFHEEILNVETKACNETSSSDNCMVVENDVKSLELAQNELKDNISENESIEELENIEKKNLKKRKKGIIYISNIPKHMNVTRLREHLGQYGDIQRVYLQPEKFSLEKQKKKKKRLTRHFTEGWVEFTSKRAAKKIPELLNNTQIGSRKKSQFYDCVWSIKYLPRFKWVHLTERINYERAVYKQRLRAEVSQARKEATFFQNNLDKSEFIKKKNKKAKLKQ